MNIIYCGSADFSMPSLEYIYHNHDLVAILTQPDKPQGRGLKMQCSKIKNFSLNHNIKLFQPENLNDENFISLLSRFNIDIILAVSYGKIFPEKMIKIPKICCLNVHPALLPGYKGPSPIRWVLINGETVTGVSSHVIDEHIDAGKIIYQSTLEIEKSDTYDSLYQKLSILAADVVKRSLNTDLLNMQIKITDVYRTMNFYARKLNKEDLYINWNKSSQEILNLIRALYPEPCAQTVYRNELIKIYSSELATNIPMDSFHKTGQILYADQKNGIVIKTNDGSIKLLEIQKQNKKRLYYKDFLNGIKIIPGEVLSNVKN
ncbi:MAG: methionyl-tRNA formyltransferase [bacterium]|nr:methionyl-tRNA formyltransferase [bacterium]